MQANGTISLVQNQSISDPFEFISQIMSFFEKDTILKISELDVHKFFLDCKRKHPALFENILFDDDPDIPYSEDIAEAMLRIEDAGFISRPNPSLNEYYLKVELRNTNDQIVSEQRNLIESISSQFKDAFASTD